tara:strand:+ start:628 stop:837 length:210 start_codon:yes stop_codon:yes gene_type:complete
MRIFTDHPNSNGESYWEHMRFALNTAFRLKMLALAVFTHTLFPFLFTSTMSSGLYKLVDEMEMRGQRRR